MLRIRHGVLVGAFNQGKALAGTFSVTVKTLPMVDLQLYLLPSTADYSSFPVEKHPGHREWADG